MEDWDLLAVVRGHTNKVEFPITTTISNPNFMSTNMELDSSQSSNSLQFPNMSVQHQDDLFQNYPHLFESTTPFDELEEFYKPFYPSVAATAVIDKASFTLSPATVASEPLISTHAPKQAELQASPKSKIAKEQTAKYKKRKNQVKRVVKEVKEEGVSSDKWAWRKYGQKPIKGSPYPRSYYRCSSSKGCSARKQVERSPANPDIFIITYTAEHSHPHPTRRNSLAGSTRTKFPGPTKPIPHDNHHDQDHHDSDAVDCSSSKDVQHDVDSVTTNNSSDQFDTKIDALNIENENNNGQYLYASLDDLERGLEELDEETSKSGLGFEDWCFDDEQFNSNDANWFIDHYNATLTGAC